MYEKDILRFLDRHNYINVIPKAALIDMDGVLYDSMPRHARAWRQMTCELGMEIPEEEFYLYEGMTGEATINLLYNKVYGHGVPADRARELYRRKSELFQAMPDVPQMPGAAEMLRFLDTVGMKRVLVTGSGQRSLLDRLALDYPGAFSEDLMVTSADVTKGKPDPEPYLMGMKKAELQADRCIAIENAPLGVESADRAGAFTIGLTTGPIPREALLRAGAAVVFDTMLDFVDALPLLLYSLITTSRNYN